MFCFRILVSRCYRHVVPTIVELIIIKIFNKIGKIIPALDNTYKTTGSSIILDIESESPVYSNTNMVPSNSLDAMYDALYDPIRSKQFIMFAEQALYFKHVYFLLRVTEFIDNSDGYLVESSKQANDNIKLNALECYNLYIRSGGDRHINIQPDTRNNIINHLGKWNNQVPIITTQAAQTALDSEHLDLFKAAFDEVSVILYQNVWHKFRQYEIEQALCQDFI
jgi:hypothetical protein